MPRTFTVAEYLPFDLINSKIAPDPLALMSVPTTSEKDPNPTDVPVKVIPDFAVPVIAIFLILLSVNLIGFADGEDADVKGTNCLVVGSLYIVNEVLLIICFTKYCVPADMPPTVLPENIIGISTLKVEVDPTITVEFVSNVPTAVTGKFGLTLINKSLAGESPPRVVPGIKIVDPDLYFIKSPKLPSANAVTKAFHGVAKLENVPADTSSQ